jgi:lipoprotein-anchoring transpeptidase ErfK/SrfK
VNSNRKISVSITQQTLDLVEDDKLLRRYPVSTAARGAGEKSGSFCTPRGRHIVRAKIGEGCEPGAVFVGRRATGEVCTPGLLAAEPDRDWILSRILWLSGMEPGYNRLGDVDTMRRYIYIHGTPHEQQIGKPHSMGCIRMLNKDVIELFDLIDTGTQVMIYE